jgi:hypothetical protein
VARQDGRRRVPEEGGGGRKRVWPHVHVEHLQRGGRDQLASAGEDAGGLRAADGLAAGEHDEARALGEEARQIGLGRQLSGRVDDERQPVLRGHGGQHRDVLACRPTARSGDRDRRRSDRRLDLPGL